MMSNYNPSEAKLSATNIHTPFTLGDNIKSPSDFIQKKLQAVQSELNTYHLDYLARHAQGVCSEEEKEIIAYQEQLFAEQQRFNREQDARAAAENSRFTGIKKALGFGKNIFQNVGLRLGLFGVAIQTALDAVQKTVPLQWASYLLRVVAAPLALASMTANAIEDIYDTWNDDQRGQRITRYGANLATIGLLGAGIAVMLGVTASIIAAPIALPAVLLGMLGVAYYKNHSIHKGVEQDIVTVNGMIESKQQALSNAVDAMFTSPSPAFQAILKTGRDDDIRKAVNQDPKIQRLVFQLNDDKVQLKRLELQRDHANSNKKGLAGMFFGIGIALLGVVFPPAGLALAMIGGVIFLASSTSFKQKVPASLLSTLNRSIECERDMLDERSLVYLQCVQQLRVHSAAAASAVVHSSPVLPHPELTASRPVTPPVAAITSSAAATMMMLAANTDTSPRTFATGVVGSGNSRLADASSRYATMLVDVYQHVPHARSDSGYDRSEEIEESHSPRAARK